METSESGIVEKESNVLSFARSDVGKVIEIVELATTAPQVIPDEKSNSQWRRSIGFVLRHERKTLSTTVALILVLEFLPFLSRYLDHDFLVLVTLIVAVLAVVFGALILLSNIADSLPFVNELRRQPYAAFFRLLRATTSNDLRFLGELAHCNQAAVHYVLKQYQYQRQAQEKRGGTLAGNIDRIGLFPALAAVALLWPNLQKAPFGSWLAMLVPLILAFHLLNLFGFTLQQRMDRIIALLETSVSLSKK
jgi:hypothetical protein